MGLLDHRKTWSYRVTATPGQCVQAFAKAFSGGGLLMRADWDVLQSPGGGVAIYGGRKGFGTLARMSRTGAQEEETAIGSEVKFEVSPMPDGRTECSMWLASSGGSGVGGMLGMTSDARFIRPYMQKVGSCLAELDPNMEVARS